MIIISELSKEYNNGNTKIFSNVNVTIKDREIVALLGENGSGKTTLLKCICGLVQANEGKIYIDGLEMNQSNFNTHMYSIGVVLEGIRNLYWRMKVQDNLQYFGALKGLGKTQIIQRVNELNKIHGLNITELSNRPVKELSIGQKQKVAIFIALLHRPKFLILDEPFNGIDKYTKYNLSNLLLNIRNNENVSILLTSHIDDKLINLADKEILLKSDNAIVIQKNQ
ncbi:ABC transporter ATP-binding protein [Clostridium sp. D2Q-14]|uniref:ABC transporter ATP-binding protein n=1 Tax=Anaeromonas gelatinilytica TaxID=2683194 RepID=UPI00193BFA48|nr:ABC transporter ATP-binding protein [Anaeromonas gelatinilytica]MBS4535677.1 ABC transporter ATP-binding protein [Anaeromonas gelatinilytica]